MAPTKAMLDWYVYILQGRYPGHDIVAKFGRNSDVDMAAVEDVTITGGTITWQTTAQFIEIASDDADDTAAGAGAQQLQIFGLDANFALQDESIELDGTSTVTSEKRYIRLFRAFTCRTGTYHGSNQGAITLTYATSSDTALTIAADAGQTEFAGYTIPAGKTGYLVSLDINVDSQKTATVSCHQYPNADDVTAPYSGAQRRVLTFDGLTGNNAPPRRTPIEFAAKTDIWWRADAAANHTAVSIDFDILLIDDGA